jgi:hypothetical protein
MVAAAHGHEQIVGASESDRCDHVGDARTADNQCRMLVVHRVEDLAGLVVAHVAGTEQWATHAGLEFLHGGFREDCI